MLNIFESNKHSSNASARVVDGKLVLSLPDAQTPVVWQMDLTGAKASALEVRHSEENGLYTLTLKTPKGETIDIAPFDNREFAVEGLMAASGALENAHGQIRPISTDAPTNDQHTPYATAPQKPKGLAKKLLISIAAIIAIIVLLNVWRAQMPLSSSVQAVSTASDAASTHNPRQTSGVAVSADAFLNAQ